MYIFIINNIIYVNYLNLIFNYLQQQIMPKAIVIEKNTNKKEVNINIETINIEKLSQACGFRKHSDFENHIIWETEFEENVYDIYLFGKTTGRANTENKYEFPPPVENILFFGNCLLIACFNGTEVLSDLTIKQWDKIYEHLFGGFEDLGSETSSEDELENVPDELKTEEGYLKDDFVVDDNDALSIELDGSCDDSDETLLISDNESDEETDDDNEIELNEEAYIYTDDENK